MSTVGNNNIFLISSLWIFQQAKAEQEEEFISNTLLKKIQALKKEKETLAHHYEQEEECLTNDLSRKLTQVGLSSVSSSVQVTLNCLGLHFFLWLVNCKLQILVQTHSNLNFCDI
jgi:hypothetical protein